MDDEAHKHLNFRQIPLRFLMWDPRKLFLIRPIARAFRHTKLKFAGLSQMYDIIADIDKRNVKGSIVETGCYKGGCGAFMAYCSERNGSNRTVWLLDSFEGLSEPTPKDRETADKPKEHIQQGNFAATPEDVDRAIESMGLLRPQNVRVVKGWFEQTIPKVKSEIGNIAILRLDADLYEPTKYCLEELYDQVVPGGYVVIDDYRNWVGCRRAVHEFICEHKINPFIELYPFGVAYFKKQEA